MAASSRTRLSVAPDRIAAVHQPAAGTFEIIADVRRYWSDCVVCGLPTLMPIAFSPSDPGIPRHEPAPASAVWPPKAGSGRAANDAIIRAVQAREESGRDKSISRRC
jgi:hypothetical protein